VFVLMDFPTRHFPSLYFGQALYLGIFKKIAAAERRKRQRQNKTWKRYEKKTLGVFEHHTCAYFYNNSS
jgi:hypothetical protein